MYKKMLLLVFLTFLTIATGFSEKFSTAFMGPNDPPPKIPPATIGNWNNLMDPRGCVMLDNVNSLKIKGVITLGTDQLDNAEDMFVYTQFQDEPAETHGPINQWTFTPVEIQGIGTVYTLLIEGYTGEFEMECDDNPEAPIAFSYSIILQDGDGNPFPFDLYPELLYIEQMGSGSEPPTSIIPTTNYEGFKDLCCYGYPGTPTGGEGFVENDNNSIEIENSIVSNNQEGDQIDLNAVTTKTKSEVFPNPFSNSLNINLEAKSNELINIQIWDINGRLIHQTEFLSDYKGSHRTQINTSQLKTGFYLCSIKSDVQSQTFKILKTKE